MFKNLFGGNKEDKLLKSKLQQIEDKFQDEDFEDVITESEQIIGEVSDKKKKLHLLKIIALAHFNLKNYEQAIHYFKEINELDSDNPNHSYNLCTAHILNQRPEEGLEYLEKAIVLYQEKGTKDNIPISFMMFYSISALVETEEYNHAFDLIDRLAGIYKEISITDSQFLYSRGFVPFHTFLEKVQDTLMGQDKVDAIEWLNDFAPALDEDGQAQVEELIEDLKTEQLPQE